MANRDDSNEPMNSSMYLEEEKSGGPPSSRTSRQGSRQTSRQMSRQEFAGVTSQGSGRLPSRGSMPPQRHGSKGVTSQERLNLYDNEWSGRRYVPELHDLGRPKQRLTERVQALGIPGQTVAYHSMAEGEESEEATVYDEHGYPVNKEKGEFTPEEQNMWEWSESGKLKISCAQPVVPVPIVQDILRRDKIILVPQVEVTDVIAPKVYNQNITHEVPKVNVEVEDTYVDIPNVRYVEKEVIVPIITGYTHKFVPKWEIHEVPRPIMKYIGQQKIVEVEVPEIKYVDKIVEREVVVDTVEKRVPKIIEVPKYTDEVQYVWKPIEKIVYVQKMVPKFDVNLDCPPPLIVPYPVQTVKKIPPVMVKRDTKIPVRNYEQYNVPTGSVRVPEEYIQHFSKLRRSQAADSRNCLFNCCDGRQSQNSDQHMSFENVTQAQVQTNQMKQNIDYLNAHSDYVNEQSDYANQRNDYANERNEYLDSSDSFVYPTGTETRSVANESNPPSRINESAPSISVQN